MNIFQLVDRTSSEPSLRNNEIFIKEGERFALERIQFSSLNVAYLKENYGDLINFTFNFAGKLLIAAGVSYPGESIIWCGEKTVENSSLGKAELEINLSKIKTGELKIFLYGLEESVLVNTLPLAVEKDVPLEAKLYKFISPTYDLCSVQEMYYNFDGKCSYYSFEDKTVHLKCNSSVDLLTYYNAFSACKWKKYTNVDHLSIYLDFAGEAIAEVVHLYEKGTHILAAWKLRARKRTTLELPIVDYPDNGIIGVRIHADKDSVLYGGGYFTKSPDTQPVRLGIGITSYRREDAVKASVARLGKIIAEHPLYHDTISITVVDNGQTLVPEDVPMATLIPNRNLGGTCGFMRNLIHYESSGKYTHCIFMDDDACCEPESIFRSITFLRHAKKASVAISGAMLSENIKFLQWEKGAWFDGLCHPLHSNYDLRKREVLLENESEESPGAVYGAWWFFLFPISKVEMYSFPFFVRGDDIEFSYTNKFEIVSMNGISVWSGDFKLKESPMTLYLDIRSHIVHHLVIKNLDHGASGILKMVWRFFKWFNWGYQYDTAYAIVSSFADTLKGPKFWLDNMDMSNIRKTIKRQCKIEVGKPLRDNYKDIPSADNDIRLPFLSTFLRRVSFNGHLMPSFLLRKEMNRLHKWQLPLAHRFFLRDKVLVCNEINQIEIILERNTKYFFKNLFYMILVSMIFCLKFNSLKNKYRNFMEILKTNEFWIKQFDDKQGA